MPAHLDAGDVLEVSWYQPKEADGMLDYYRIALGQILTPACIKQDNSLVIQTTVTVEGAMEMIPAVAMGLLSSFLLF